MLLVRGRARIQMQALDPDLPHLYSSCADLLVGKRGLKMSLIRVENDY